MPFYPKNDMDQAYEGSKGNTINWNWLIYNGVMQGGKININKG